MTRFGLDFDNTYTRDPELWNGFIATVKARGHQVWIVTARRDTDENREIVQVPGCFVVFTGLQAKLKHCEGRGLNIDIWIDDDPHSITEGH